jgi:hypothetical protein
MVVIRRLGVKGDLLATVLILTALIVTMAARDALTEWPGWVFTAVFAIVACREWRDYLRSVEVGPGRVVIRNGSVHIDALVDEAGGCRVEWRRRWWWQWQLWIQAQTEEWHPVRAVFARHEPSASATRSSLWAWEVSEYLRSGPVGVAPPPKVGWWDDWWRAVVISLGLVFVALGQLVSVPLAVLFLVPAGFVTMAGYGQTRR